METTCSSKNANINFRTLFYATFHQNFVGWALFQVGGEINKMSELEDSVHSGITPKEEMEDRHKELAMDMFKKITEYLNGELAGEGASQNTAMAMAQ